MSKHVCGTCGNKIDVDARFCPHCGSKNIVNENLCPNCHYENEADARFCVSCGKPLTPGAKKSKKHSSHKPGKGKAKARAPVSSRKEQSPLSFPIILAGLILIGAVAVYFTSNRGARTSSGKIMYEQPTSNVALENNVVDIASQFSCACGSCGEESLEKCLCPTAQKERQMIRELLQQGKDKKQVIAMVNEVYGHLKTNVNFP
ncbi:MAG: zinc-ribbon domain-containing protein [Calditrichaeota bacterium]|nr:MAG: zinc-ribbon domain-containing protein [Calditrichota bacterium]